MSGDKLVDVHRGEAIGVTDYYRLRAAASGPESAGVAKTYRSTLDRNGGIELQLDEDESKPVIHVLKKAATDTDAPPLIAVGLLGTLGGKPSEQEQLLIRQGREAELASSIDQNDKDAVMTLLMKYIEMRKARFAYSLTSSRATYDNDAQKWVAKSTSMLDRLAAGWRNFIDRLTSRNKRLITAQHALYKLSAAYHEQAAKDRIINVDAYTKLQDSHAKGMQDSLKAYEQQFNSEKSVIKGGALSMLFAFSSHSQYQIGTDARSTIIMPGAESHHQNNLGTHDKERLKKAFKVT